MSRHGTRPLATVRRDCAACRRPIRVGDRLRQEVRVGRIKLGAFASGPWTTVRYVHERCPEPLRAALEDARAARRKQR